GNAADIDDTAGLLRQHDRRYVLDAQQDAADIDREQLVDGRHVDLGDADHRRRHAGIVDQTIHTAKPFDSLIDHGLHIGLVGNVGPHETDAEPLFQRTALFLPARGDNDFGSFLDEEFDDPFADAARTT